MTSTSPEQPDESARRADPDGDSVLSGESSTGDASGSDPYSPSATTSGSEGDASRIGSPAGSAAPYSAPSGPEGGYSPPSSDPSTAPPAYGQDAGGRPPHGATAQGQGYQPPQAGDPGQPGYPTQGDYPPQAGYPQQGGYQPPAAGGYQQPSPGYGPQGGGQYSPPPPAYPNQPGYPPQQYAGQQPVGQPPIGQQPMGPQPMTQSDERLWATLSHISIPFIGVVGPLIVYLVFKDRSAFLKDQGTESLNFSILYTIAQVAGWILTSVTIGILFFLPMLIFIAVLVLCIMAAIAANKGEAYRYPINWRLIK